MKKFDKTTSKFGIRTYEAPLLARLTPWFMHRAPKKVSCDIMPYLAGILAAEKKKREAVTMDITPHVGKILAAAKKKQASVSIMPQLSKILEKTRN